MYVGSQRLKIRWHTYRVRVGERVPKERKGLTYDGGRSYGEQPVLAAQCRNGYGVPEDSVRLCIVTHGYGRVELVSGPHAVILHGFIVRRAG